MDGLSLNRYAYCANDPVNFIDPSGMALRNNMVLMSDGGGAKSTAKTTPIVAKPRQSKASSAAAASRTVAVPMTDTGTGGYKSAGKAAGAVAGAVTGLAYTGYAGSTAAPANGTSHHSGSFADSPTVSDIGNGRYSCGKDINALGAGEL